MGASSSRGGAADVTIDRAAEAQDSQSLVIEAQQRRVDSVTDQLSEKHKHRARKILRQYDRNPNDDGDSRAFATPTFVSSDPTSSELCGNVIIICGGGTTAGKDDVSEALYAHSCVLGIACPGLLAWHSAPLVTHQEHADHIVINVAACVLPVHAVRYLLLWVYTGQIPPEETCLQLRTAVQQHALVLPADMMAYVTLPTMDEALSIDLLFDLACNGDVDQPGGASALPAMIPWYQRRLTMMLDLTTETAPIDPVVVFVTGHSDSFCDAAHVVARCDLLVLMRQPGLAAYVRFQHIWRSQHPLSAAAAASQPAAVVPIERWDISPAATRALVAYLYTGTLDVDMVPDTDDVVSLMMAAHCWMLSGLVYQCGVHLLQAVPDHDLLMTVAPVMRLSPVRLGIVLIQRLLECPSVVLPTTPQDVHDLQRLISVCYRGCVKGGALTQLARSV